MKIFFFYKLNMNSSRHMSNHKNYFFPKKNIANFEPD